MIHKWLGYIKGGGGVGNVIERTLKMMLANLFKLVSPILGKQAYGPLNL